MAASGIQEHNEARRKQMHMERLAFLHKMLNDKYRSTYEAEVNDRTRINYDPLGYRFSDGSCECCCVARRNFANDVGYSTPSCRMLDQDYPYFCRAEPNNRTGREMAHAPPIGHTPQGYKYVYDATPTDLTVACHHSADYFPQDRFRISYDWRPNVWAGRPHAYTVPIGYRPDERTLISYDFKPRPSRAYTYMTQVRASSGTNQYTPYAEMFSAKLPKRFTTILVMLSIFMKLPSLTGL